ncbi:hypothetical protein CEXT_86911 [Caerostris extrusa]|uniref:Uncharacterized protein n=1 Tax=Caerostris extrusa TaxID=172846 RepID=A0AAV4SN88_CAEEX|nr:hypothetical protein CEXT_86911 [Caerostris extrusa]
MHRKEKKFKCFFVPRKTASTKPGTSAYFLNFWPTSRQHYSSIADIFIAEQPQMMLLRFIGFPEGDVKSPLMFQ